jgi:plastocyanin
MEPRARIGFLVSAVFLTALTLGALLPAVATETTRTHIVLIEGMKFTPTELRAGPGDRVVFQNKDLLPHTATAKEPKAFDSGLIKAGDSWTLQLARSAQTIRYVCLYHPTMEGQIIVKGP